MAILKRLLITFLFIFCLPLSSSVSAAETAPAETAKEFYQRHMEEASSLKQEAENQVRYHDSAQKYKALVDQAVQWEKEGLDLYGYDNPDLPRLGGDAYFKSKAMREYGRHLGLDYRQQIELADDPYKKFSLLQEWTNKAFDYVGASFNDSWDEQVVSYKDVMDRLSQAFGSELVIEWSLGPYDYGLGRRPGVAKQILAALDDQIGQETDPLARFEFLRGRIKKTEWVFKTVHDSGNSVFDERLVPELGKNSLGESKILKEQSIAIVQDLKALIDNELDAQTKKHLAERLVDIVRWLKKEWDKLGYYNDYYRPDMSDWPDSIDDLIDTSSLPAAPQLPAVTNPQPPTAPTTVSQCNLNGYIQCRDKFNLQGCIDACPFVDAACPPGTPPDTECKQTDEECSNKCWDKGNSHGSQCAAINHCSMQEIDEGLRAQ